MAIVIDEGITAIGAACFKNCSNIVSVTIPDTLEEIQYGAFSGCSGIRGDIYIPSGVKVIASSAAFSARSASTFRMDS